MKFIAQNYLQFKITTQPSPQTTTTITNKEAAPKPMIGGKNDNSYVVAKKPIPGLITTTLKTPSDILLFSAIPKEFVLVFPK